MIALIALTLVVGVLVAVVIALVAARWRGDAARNESATIAAVEKLADGVVEEQSERISELSRMLSTASSDMGTGDGDGDRSGRSMVEEQEEVAASATAAHSSSATAEPTQAMLHDESNPVMIMPQRFKSDDVKLAANKVLLPKLMAHNAFITRCKKRARLGEITPQEAKDQIHESSRVFTERYAHAVQLAKKLANETGVVTLRRLASSDETWVAAEMHAALMGNTLPDEYVPQPEDD